MIEQEFKNLKNNLIYNIITMTILIIILPSIFSEKIFSLKNINYIKTILAFENNNILAGEQFFDFLLQVVLILSIIFLISLYSLFGTTPYITERNHTIKLTVEIKEIVKRTKIITNITLKNLLSISIVIISLLLLSYILNRAQKLEIFIYCVTNILALIIIFNIFIKKLITNIKINYWKYKYAKFKFHNKKLILLKELFCIIKSTFISKKIKYILIIAFIAANLICLFLSRNIFFDLIRLEIFLIISYEVIKLIFIKLNKFKFYKVNSHLNKILILLILIFLSTQEIKLIYFGFYFCFILSIVKFSAVIVKLIFGFLVHEHRIAKLEKQELLNYESMELLIKNSEFKDEQRIKNIIYNQLTKKDYTLHILSGFNFFLKDIDLKVEEKNKLKKSYSSMLLNHDTISKKIGLIVKSRNLKNLMIPVLLIILILSAEWFINTTSSFSSNINKIRVVIFFIIFYRLITRFIEISIAFYYDIKPSSALNKTNLTNNDRVVLVFKSLIEITLLSSILYFEHQLLKINAKSFSDIIFVLGESIKYAVAVAFFNVSYPINFIKDITKFSHFENPREIYTTYVVHLIQLLMSVLLLSLSFNAYSSRNSSGSTFQLKQAYNGNFYVVETLSNQNIGKTIVQSPDMNSLLDKLNEMWTNKKIDNDAYIKIKNIINFSYYKV